MPNVRYQPLGPVLAGEGSRAFLGLEIDEGGHARPVVLVWVPEAMANDPEALAKLRRDTALAEKLEHHNVIRVMGLVPLEGGVARVVEFVNGESLRRILDAGKKLPAPLAARIVADAAQGVHYAQLAGHEDGSPMIHGDLRPETLLVSFEGVCKVTGYGAVQLAPKELGGQRIPGRRFHSAPEQILGGREAINRQTDVYLLGLLLYECLTGTIPFSDQAEFDRAILNRPLPVPLPDLISPSLFHLIKNAMAKKASDRHPTPLAFREALEQAAGKLASEQEVATYLTQLFPENHSARSARRKEIEAGLADAPQMTPVPAPVAEPQVFSPSPLDEPRPSRVRLVLVAVGVLAIAIVGYLVLPKGSEEPTTTAPALVNQDARLMDAGGNSAASPPVHDAGGLLAEARSEQPDASPMAELERPPPPVSPEAQSPPAATTLQLSVEPAVDLTIDGRHIGKSPVELPLAAGKHTVQLNDPERLIHLSRTVSVGAKGKTSVHLTVGSGFVKIIAPPGAKISIDGKPMGAAPLNEFPIFEGRHRIVVNFESAKWQESFSVKPGEHVTFNVETTPPPPR